MEVMNYTNSVKNGINVRNAGAVILNSYFTVLFERLELTKNNRFISIENQKKAVKYLECLVTGQTHTNEAYLSLNKILCGLSINDTLTDDFEISESDRVLINSLLKSVISHWNAIGDCSIEGFRGNWLVRNGILVELEDKWELTIEKRAYDILILRSPFSFSIIKLPWMNKPLHVHWSY